MSEPTVYLAGPVAAYENGGAEWRQKVQAHYGDEYTLLDPLAKYNVPASDLDVLRGTTNPDNPETVGVEEIVESDKAMIDDADGVIVGYTAVRSIGTPMEVMYARERGKPVAIWLRDDTELEELSPWYRYHATAVTTDAGMALSHAARDHGRELTGVGVRA